MTKTTTPETDKLHEDETYLTKKGTEFVIEPAFGTGLYCIKMKKGGKAPSFCDEKFTSFRAANDVLENYLISTDRYGQAKYPSKES